MLRKKGVLVVALFAFVFLSINLISAAIDCNVVDRSACDTSDREYIVMGLSAETNAHGELYAESNYGKVLCCGFGDGDRSCGAGSNLLDLSSTTNAHAEKADGISYSNEVCYSNMECESGVDTCSAGYDEVLSMSGETNAHLGIPGTYSKKICCKQIQSRGSSYWSNVDGNTQLESYEFTRDKSKVYLVYNETGTLEGTEITFKIIEDDLINEEITSVTGVADSSGFVRAEWLITSGDIDDAQGCLLGICPDQDNVFFFEVFDSLGAKIGVSEGTLTLTERAISTESRCNEYVTETECLNDPNGVGEISAEDIFSISCGTISQDNNGCDVWKDCSCSWNATATGSKCGPSYVANRENNCGAKGGASCPSAGKCSMTGKATSDCSEGGFITFEWTANFNWNPLNSFTSNHGGDDFIQSPTGTWRCDPASTSTGKRMSESCNSKTEEILCPAQIKLPFFSFMNFIIAIVVIGVVYYLINTQKGKKKRKTSSKKTSKKRKN